MICDSNLHNLHKAEENQTLSYDRNSSDGEASLKRQKSPETTTDTQDVSKYYWFYV